MYKVIQFVLVLTAIITLNILPVNPYAFAENSQEATTDTTIPGPTPLSKATSIDDVSQKLSELGYNEEQIESLLSQLTQEELDFIVQNPDVINDGGVTDPTGLTLVLTALVVYLLLNVVNSYDWP